MEALKNAAISAQILAKIAIGATLPVAFNTVLGNGAYEKMISEVYDALRNKG